MHRVAGGVRGLRGIMECRVLGGNGVVVVSVVSGSQQGV